MPTRKKTPQSESLDLKDLVIDPKNARKRTDRSAEMIKASLSKFGGMRSVVIDEKGIIRAGNGTIAEAREFGDKFRLKVVEVEGDEIVAVQRKGLSETEWVNYAIADNRTAELSEWDAEVVLELDEEYELDDWFDEEELEEFELKLDEDEGITAPHQPIERKKVLKDEKSAAEMLDKLGRKSLPIRVKPGQIWQLGRHRLIVGDITNGETVEALMDGKKADCCITDPPYGLNYSGGTRKREKLKNDNGIEDLDGFLDVAFSHIDAVLKPGSPIYIFHPAGPLAIPFGIAFQKQDWDLKQCLAWIKNRASFGASDYHYAHEPIYYGFKRADFPVGRNRGNWYGDDKQRTTIEIPRPAKNLLHPTQKPTDLIAVLMENSTESKSIVLEPFGGSGSAIIAAEMLGGVTVYTSEISPDYCTVIISRWETYTGQKAEKLETIS